ncbi:Poly(A) polymerase-like protein [Cladobotryum mycophilum]|uniref:polynucleotide adenylyltransferase n=1 Tax=Cladobotryum mycophilum TaxID=491253 RepID=A0ABR0T1Q3_9HYPO
MEASSTTLAARQPFAESHDTALCLIPPNHLWNPINRLRSLNDKAYGKWPPHLNLIYPFVRPDALSGAADAICQLNLSSQNEILIDLEHVDAFSHKKHSTIYLKPDSNASTRRLDDLKGRIRCLLGWPEDETHQLHMTVAQSEDSFSDWHNFLLEKARLLTPLSWHAGQLMILIRDPSLPDGDTTTSRQMVLWGHIDLSSRTVIRNTESNGLILQNMPKKVREAFSIYPQDAYNYVQVNHSWQCSSETSSVTTAVESPDHLIIASYNVLAEFEWPPTSHRHPALVTNILSDRAAADILVLQEVTDQFLSFLLADREVCSRYPFSTHGPPSQAGVGPLPSLLNIVILSRYPLRWKFLSSPRNKGFAIATFPTMRIKRYEGSEPLPLVLAACHLRPGLTDGAITARKHEIQRLIDYLSNNFSYHPWVIAGDFNLTTSSYTTEMARKEKDISLQSLRYLTDISDIIIEAGLHDTWVLTRLSSGESSNTVKGQESASNIFEGEQGATFDPISNPLASKLTTTDYHNRPQRYDRILVNDCVDLRPSGFNIFGQTRTAIKGDGSAEYASDHWGIRCLLMPPRQVDGTPKSAEQSLAIGLRKAPPSLASFEELKNCLLSYDCFPTQTDESLRKSALGLLEKTLLGVDHGDSESHKRTRLILALIPVGSFGLGVWTSVSDVDCLCVGSISPKTFFAVALQRLRNAAHEGITILRRVRASSGTMLEIQIHGIKFDLQYCAATSIAERFPDVMNRPLSDPAFALPLSTLSKLKPARDLYYLRRSIPDMSTYRVAHLLIKAWAKNRGLYAAKFGFLGGIHISVMLVPVCKMLAKDGKMVSAADIVSSFFHHYADFDWKTRMVFDPFFHHDIKYHRTFREPLCLLGWHPPSLNTALNASVPTVGTIAAELSRARVLISQEGMSWEKFLGLDGLKTTSLIDGGTAEFLQSYKTYVKIDARYWGSSPSKGKNFLDLDRKLPNLIPRIWPTRFVEDEAITISPDNENPEHHGCYLIGLEMSIDVAGEKHDTNTVTSREAIYLVLRDFESRIRGDEKYYDSKCCWMAASVAHARDVESLQLDRTHWWDHDPGDSDSGDDLDNDYDEIEYGGDNDEQLESRAGQKSKTTHSKGGNIQSANKPPGAGKFRSAMDVMHRLRWDTNINSSDYLVGYEDRFLGAQEKPLEHWKSEQTDEEFIPQHRILYFKRKSDGSIVWERKSRTDKIFGSG